MTLYRASVPAVTVVRHHCHPFDTDMMIRNAGKDASIFDCRSQDFIVKLLLGA